MSKVAGGKVCPADTKCPAPLVEQCSATYLNPCDYTELSNAINEYKSNWDGEALYNIFIKSSGGTALGSPYREAVNKITSSPSNAFKQITYDMSQLAAARVKCEEGLQMSGLSGNWWKQNIWGETPVQNALYIFSLMVMIYLNARILISLVGRKEGGLLNTFIAPAITKATGGNVMIPVIILSVSFLVFATITINYTTKIGGESDEDVAARRQTGLNVMGTITGLMVLLTIGINFFRLGSGTGMMPYLADIVNIITFSIFLLVNFALSAYIPQFMLIAMVFQKYFYTPWRSGEEIEKTGDGVIVRTKDGKPKRKEGESNLLDMLIRFVSFVVPVGTAAYFSQTNNTGNKWLMYFLIGFMTVTAVQSTIMYLRDKLSTINERVFNGSDSYGWSLVLFPLYRFIISGGDKDDEDKGKKTTFSSIFVQNSKLFE